MNITIERWKPDQRNTRQGYVTLRFADLGLEVRDVVVHHFTDRDRWWLAFPAREYVDRQGQKKWWAFLAFDEDTNRVFQAAALDALREAVPQLFAEHAPAPEIQRPATAPPATTYRKPAGKAPLLDRAARAQAPLGGERQASARDFDDSIPF